MAGDVHDHNPDEDDGQIVLRARVGLEAGDLGAVAAVVVVAVGGGHGRGGGVVVVDDQGGRAASVAECEGATDACKKETKRNVTLIYLSTMSCFFRVLRSRLKILSTLNMIEVNELFPLCLSRDVIGRIDSLRV